ncbi:TspO/MBR family protein [Halalkalicoccus salilacus]
MAEISLGGVRIGRRELLGGLVAVIAINLLGAFGVPFTTPDSAWFQGLEKPWFYPPGALFGIVWTVLFSLMGIAIFLVYRRDRAQSGADRARGLRAPDAPQRRVVADVLHAAGAACGARDRPRALAADRRHHRAFDRVDRRAALLLVPYLAWVSFAAVLNYSLWRLN